MNTRLLLISCLAFLLPVGCGDGDDGNPKEAIHIGMLTISQFAANHRLVAEAAVNAINDQGGIDGRDLVLHVEDLQPPPLPENAVTAFERLINDHGVVAVIGPTTSGEAQALVPLAKERGIPIISSSSTVADLVNEDDDNFLFRNVVNDSLQVAMMIEYIKNGDPEAYPPPYLVLYSDDGYGTGLNEGLSALGTDVTSVAFPSMLNVETDADRLAQIFEQIDAAAPGTIILASTDAAVTMANAWAARPEKPINPPWFFTDGARTEQFEMEIDLSFVGSRGTAPAKISQGSARESYISLYKEYRPAEDMTTGDEAIEANLDSIYTAQTWDAVFLLAGGLVVQVTSGQEPGGAALATAISETSKDGIPWNAGEWRDFLDDAQAGNGTDYSGASGPTDLDACGEATGPFEVWEIGEDRTYTVARGYTVQQVNDVAQMAVICER